MKFGANRTRRDGNQQSCSAKPSPRAHAAAGTSAENITPKSRACVSSQQFCRQVKKVENSHTTLQLPNSGRGRSRGIAVRLPLHSSVAALQYTISRFMAVFCLSTTVTGLAVYTCNWNSCSPYSLHRSYMRLLVSSVPRLYIRRSNICRMVHTMTLHHSELGIKKGLNTYATITNITKTGCTSVGYIWHCDTKGAICI
ncbi:hypothetical protein MPTK2_3g17040 [Marchantia polymorpha subsp. ruderalis]